MDKFTIHYDRQGESGNIFWILQAIYEACKREGDDPTMFKSMKTSCQGLILVKHMHISADWLNLSGL